MVTSFLKGRNIGLVRHLCCALLGFFAWGFVGAVFAQAATPLRNIAFYYGPHPVAADLGHFQFVVLEPDAGFLPAHLATKKTNVLAYVSVGEVTKVRSYYAAMPQSWLIGKNYEWSSEIIDQSAPGWPKFFVTHIIEPLWKRGYRGFFLDTLDSYQQVAKNEGERRRAQEGLVDVIMAIKHRFPRATLILNRGFELLPRVHDAVYAVAFESLFKGWDEASGKYVGVSASDRTWLLSQAAIVKNDYHLPVIAIDYCPPADLECASTTLRRIRELGLVPYVGDGRLQTLDLTAAQ